MKAKLSVVAGFASGLFTEVLASWADKQWRLSEERFLLTLAIFCGLLLLAWLGGSGLRVPGAFFVHRAKYLAALAASPALSKWRDGFAPLHMRRPQRYVASAAVFEGGRRHNLVALLRRRLTDGAREAPQRALVLGEPGSGKSTAVERLAWELANHAAGLFGFRGLIPIPVRADDPRESEDLRSLLLDALRRWCPASTQRILTTEEALDNLLASGRLVFLVDGLDEVRGERRTALLAALARAARQEGGARVAIVATCRTRQDPGDALADFQPWSVVDLDDDSVLAFAGIYAPNLDPIEVFDRLAHHGFLEPGGLGRNPFWLIELIEGELHHATRARILAASRDKKMSKELTKPVSGERAWRKPAGWTREQFIDLTTAALAEIAVRSGAAEPLSRDEARVVVTGVIEAAKDRLGFTDVPRADDILEFARDSRLLSKPRHRAGFSHRIALEYFRAEYWVRDPESLAEALQAAPELPDTWESLALCAGLLDSDARDALIEGLLDDRPDSHGLACAIALWVGCGDIHRSALRPRLLHRLREELSAGQEMDRELLLSMQSLVVRGGDEAVHFLGRLLADAEPAVRRRVCRVLGLTDRSSAVRLLAFVGLDDRNDSVTEEAAQSLAIQGDAAVRTLIRVLHASRRTRARRAADALGRIGGPVATVALLDAPVADDDAVDALERCGPVGRLQVRLALQSSSARTRRRALQLISRGPVQLPGAVWDRLLGDPSDSVATTAADLAETLLGVAASGAEEAGEHPTPTTPDEELLSAVESQAKSGGPEARDRAREILRRHRGEEPPQEDELRPDWDTPLGELDVVMGRPPRRSRSAMEELDPAELVELLRHRRPSTMADWAAERLVSLEGGEVDGLLMSAATTGPVSAAEAAAEVLGRRSPDRAAALLATVLNLYLEDGDESGIRRLHAIARPCLRHGGQDIAQGAEATSRLLRSAFPGTAALLGTLPAAWLDAAAADLDGHAWSTLDPEAMWSLAAASAHPRTAAFIADVLETGREEDRERAARRCGVVGRPQTLSALLTVLNSPETSTSLKATCRESLRLLGPAFGAGTLDELMVPRAVSTDVLAAVVEAVGAAGWVPASMEQRLTTLLRHPEPPVANAAAEAIRRCATREFVVHAVLRGLPPPIESFYSSLIEVGGPDLVGVGGRDPGGSSGAARQASSINGEAQSGEVPDDSEDPFSDHLAELGTRFLAVVGTCVVSGALFGGGAQALMEWAAVYVYGGSLEALAAHLPPWPFLFEASAVFGVALLGWPMFVYQAWRFVRPGFYGHEQDLVRPLALSVAVLPAITVCAIAVISRLIHWLGTGAPTPAEQVQRMMLADRLAVFAATTAVWLAGGRALAHWFGVQSARKRYADLASGRRLGDRSLLPIELRRMAVACGIAYLGGLATMPLVLDAALLVAMIIVVPTAWFRLTLWAASVATGRFRSRSVISALFFAMSTMVVVYPFVGLVVLGAVAAFEPKIASSLTSAVMGGSTSVDQFHVGGVAEFVALASLALSWVVSPFVEAALKRRSADLNLPGGTRPALVAVRLLMVVGAVAVGRSVASASLVADLPPQLGAWISVRVGFWVCVLLPSLVVPGVVFLVFRPPVSQWVPVFFGLALCALLPGPGIAAGGVLYACTGALAILLLVGPPGRHRGLGSPLSRLLEGFSRASRDLEEAMAEEGKTLPVFRPRR